MVRLVTLTDHFSFLTKLISNQLPVSRVSLSLEEQDRIDYYNKLVDSFSLDSEPQSIKANAIPLWKKTAYAYDWYSMINLLDQRLCAVLFGDIQYQPEVPAFCKSRPLNVTNTNNVLLPLNTSRHFRFIEDGIPYRKKKNIGVWRGAAYKENRLNFLKSAAPMPHVNVADTSRNTPRNFFGYSTNFLSQKEQLNHKFIFCLEGNDVASNLKWVMGSNSVPVMPKPKFETWFCEGKLVSGQHYIEINDDYTDISEKLEYYLSNSRLSCEISAESKNYASTFFDINRQYSVGREVVERYFKLVAN